MPELPEVETIKNGLQVLQNLPLNQLILRHERLRYPLNPTELNQALNQKIIAITRRAKYLIFQLEHGYLLFHLGMSGRLTLATIPATPPGKHDHVDLIIANYLLRYHDPRRFGCIIYTTNLSTHTLLANLGPEPLDSTFTASYLAAKIRNRRTPIKQLIMENTIVVGVGNIYACESLFLSKISPLRQGQQINVAECASLVNNIKQVLAAAITAGGSTLRDYKQANGSMGYFQQRHTVYAKANQDCSECGSTILAVRLGQRNSFYCPSCQM